MRSIEVIISNIEAKYFGHNYKLTKFDYAVYRLKARTQYDENRDKHFVGYYEYFGINKEKITKSKAESLPSYTLRYTLKKESEYEI